MIHKSTKYGNVENVTVAEFGNGTISITNGVNANHLSLVMKTIEKNQIGTVIGGEISSDEFKPELAIVFTNKESFQVFYEFVQNIRREFCPIPEYIEQKPIIIDTPFKRNVVMNLDAMRQVTLTTEDREGKTLDHTFCTRRKAIEFIDEFFRTASEDEEIYIAE